MQEPFVVNMHRQFSCVEKEWFDEAGRGLLSGSVSATGLQRLVKKAQAAGAKGELKCLQRQGSVEICQGTLTET